MTVRRGILAGRFERSPLRRPAFARLCAGYAIAGLGHQFSLIALLWFVLDLTNSGAALGLVVICMQLPGIVTSALFGRLLDRVQPRNVLAVDNILRALLIAAIPLLHWFGALNLEMILAFAVLSGALAPATTIGLQVMLPDLVPDEELDNANALISFTTNMPYFIGPAIAGLLVAWWGGPVVILLDAIGFIVMALVVATHNLAHARIEDGSHGRAGFRRIASRSGQKLVRLRNPLAIPAGAGHHPALTRLLLFLRPTGTGAADLRA